MDWGSSVLFWAVIYFFGSMFFQLLTDPKIYQPADFTKPDLGQRSHDDSAFYWSMMMNQDE